MSAIIIHCTCPDMEVAKQISSDLLENRLVACVSLQPGITSYYHWQGKIEESREVLLIIKTGSNRFKEVSARIIGIHPYDVPEIIAIPVTDGLPQYLDWIEQCIK